MSESVLKLNKMKFFLILVICIFKIYYANSLNITTDYQAIVVRNITNNMNKDLLDVNLSNQCLRKMYNQCMKPSIQLYMTYEYYCCLLWDILECYQRNYQVNSLSYEYNFLHTLYT